MGIAVLIVELLILVAICGLVLRIFASFKKTPWYAIASTWLGWILCFAIVLLVPIDVVDADHDTCMKENNGDENACSEPIAYLPTTLMIVQWKVLYWGTFVMSWLGFPLLQTYSLAGDFSPWEKIVRSIKENVYIYIGMAVVGAIFLVGLAIAKKVSGEELMSLVMALANAYGLILVVVLMGYGLVDIPRYLFRKASRERMLVHYHAQASKLKDTMEGAKEDLDKTLRVVKRVADRVTDHDPYRPYVDHILKKCPIEYDDVTGADSDSGDITYKKLVALNCRVKEDTHAVARAVCLYEMLLRKAFAIEDITNLKEKGGSPDRKLHYSFRQPRAYKYAYIVDTLEYYWEMYLHPAAYYLLASGATILSLLVVWCEMTLVVNKDVVDLSPFSQLIVGAHMHGFGKQFFCFIPLAYMATCAYTTLFKLKLFNYYRLVPHQQSDANSIMFSANYLCRLAAPLSFNFLKFINQTDTSFSTVMGNMDAFPFLGKDFIIFFPIFVAVLCFMSLFNVWGKIGSMCCIKKLRYIPDDDLKLIGEGEKILQEERAIKEGRGPTNKSFKDNLKSAVKSATRKFMPNKNDVENPPAQITPAPAAPPAELSAVQKLRGKYTSKFDDGADMVPTTSKFSNTTSSTPSASSSATSSGPTFTPASSSSSYSSGKPRAYEDLLPPTSRFSRNAAIIDTFHEEPAAARAFTTSTPQPGSSATQRQSSVFGGLFGGGAGAKSGGKNDEVGLLPRGFPRSDTP